MAAQKISSLVRYGYHSTTVPHTIDEIFTRIIPRLNPSFEIREQQIMLSQRIERAMTAGGALAVEAGTGTGKSFSYLAPALMRAAGGKPVVIVTASIALQHQLADKDIPYMQRALGTSVPVTVLKGRSNYLCAARAAKFLQGEEGALFEKEGGEAYALLARWAARTKDGDRESAGREIAEELYDKRGGKRGADEADEFVIPSSIWQHLCAHEFACGGSACASRGMNGCFYQAARRKAFQSGIVVTNYNVLSYHFMQMMRGAESSAPAAAPAMSRAPRTEDGDESRGEGGLLPSAGAVFVLDEAHRTKGIVRDSMEISFSKSGAQNAYDALFGKSGSIESEKSSGRAFSASFTRQADACRAQMQNAFAQIEKMDALMGAAFALASERGERGGEDAPRAVMRYAEVANHALEDLFFALSKDAAAVSNALLQLAREAGEKGSLSAHIERASRWWTERADLCRAFARGKEMSNLVTFVEYSRAKKEASYCIVPLSVRDFLQQTLFKDAHAVVALSATLTAQKNFNFWGRQVGFPSDGDALTALSPFDYKRRVLLCIPEDAPEPTSDKAYSEYLADMLPALCDASRGRALILCTSKAMVATLAHELEAYARAQDAGWELLAQDGMLSAAALFGMFTKKGARYAEEGAARAAKNKIKSPVLVATATFWEGFDAPDDLLRLLVITRIPFASPEDFLFKEEKLYLEREGRDWFKQLALPIAEIKLRQGFGRLMRSSSDGGVAVITDKRMVTKSYGSLLLEQLPPCRLEVAAGSRLPAAVREHLKAFDWVQE